MAKLPEVDRIEAWAEFMRELSREHEPTEADKHTLRALIDAVDDWIDANSAAFMAALPSSSLTMKQKIRLLSFVARERVRKGVL